MKCVNFPGCESSIRVFPTVTVDPDDEDFFTKRNWGICKIQIEAHQCLLPNYNEILRLKKEEIRTAQESKAQKRKHNAQVRKARISSNGFEKKIGKIFFLDKTFVTLAFSAIEDFLIIVLFFF